MQGKAQEAGIDLNVGEFPHYGPDMDAEGTTSDPERPVRLVARMVARAADRITPLKKLSRHLEGTESKAGLLSDFTAAAFDLYGRNSEVFEGLAIEYVRGVQAKAASRRRVKGGSVEAQAQAQTQGE